jgi:hypothetical protein
MNPSAQGYVPTFRPRLMRAPRWLLTALIIAFTLLGAAAGPVLGHGAGNGNANGQKSDPHGNRGTVKVVNDDTAFRVRSNDDEGEDGAVGCSFHIQLSHFNAGQAGPWHIESWSPSGSRATVLGGTYLADSTGRYKSAVITSLANGHYKLFVGGRNSHNAKHKTFWVRCGLSAGHGAGTGSLQIVKVVSGNAAGFAGGTFSFLATCGATSAAASITLAQGVTVGATTLSGLAAGSSCNVAETGTPAAGLNALWGAPTYSPSSAVSITGGSTVSVTVTNARSVMPPPVGPGDLQIIKIISGNTSGFPGGTFLFTATCAGTPIGAVIPVGAGVTVGSTTISGLAAGTTCVVVETGTAGAGTNASWGTAAYVPANGIVTIVAGSSVAVTVTDPRSVATQTGTLQITKIVSGNTSGFPGGTFNLTATCGGTQVATSITLASGVTTGSTSIPGIAAGFSCTVIETGVPSPGVGATWGAPAYSPVNAIVTIAAGSTITVTVTNTRSVT